MYLLKTELRIPKIGDILTQKKKFNFDLKRNSNWMSLPVCDLGIHFARYVYILSLINTIDND
jgi:hypothetical protein